MATDTGEKTPRKGEIWKLCDRCDTQYPKVNLLEQQGLLVCDECFDLEDHWDEIGWSA